MSVIYVTGHRNPDMDSICSSYAYAYLKNLIDRNNEYIPCRLGSANRNIKNLFSRLNLELPVLLKDVKPKVIEVTKKAKYSVKVTDPVYTVVDIFAKDKPTVIPVFDEMGKYIDLLTADDVTAFFLKENNNDRIIYKFSQENIEKVIPGHFIKKGTNGSQEAPFMVGAMEYEQYEKRLTGLEKKPVLVTGLRDRHIKKALKENIPGLVITGIEDKSCLDKYDIASYDGFIFLSEKDTAETLRLLRLSSPVGDLLDPDNKSPEIQSDMLFDDAKDMLMNSDERGLSVFSGEDWVGYVTRRCFLTKPKQKIILTDHNEAEQSVIGIEDAEILEIIDHHRLAPPRMKNPIYICSEPLGSTCTIIYEQYKKYGLKPDQKRAEILLSGLVSDTVMLKSPTTTQYDRHVVEKLAERAKIADLQAFCSELFSSGTRLAEQDPVKVIESDLKRYYEVGVRFAIGQVEVTTLSEIMNLKDIYLVNLRKEKEAYNLDFCMLLVTDVISDTSILLTTPFDKEGRLFWEKLEDNVYNLPGVLSRKKQLLPEVLRILED